MRRGFTLIELLIVIAIIMLLLVYVLINLGGQIAKANDAKRKNDLYTLHNAIEEYNTDHSVFPPQNLLATCNGTGLQPYIKQVPCDPAKNAPYGYFISGSTGGYRVCAILQDTTDPAIAAMGCGGSEGCGLSGGYNYCLAQGTTPSAIGTADYMAGGGYAPTPTSGSNLGNGGGAAGDGGNWACGPLDTYGNSYCRYYEKPSDFGCPTTFSTSACNDECQAYSNVRCVR